MPNFAKLISIVSKAVLRDDLEDDYGDIVNEALREIQNRRSFVSMKGITYCTINPGVLGAGGNVVPLLAMWPTGSGTLSFEISGMAIGSRYYFNQGNSNGISADGTTLVTTKDNFFVATQENYFLLAAPAQSNQIITSSVITAGLDQVAELPDDFKELQPRTSVHYISDDGQFIPAEVVFEYQQYFRVWSWGGTPMMTWPPRVFFERRSRSAVLGIVEPITHHFNLKVQYYKYLPNLVEDADTNPISEAYPEMVIAKAKAIAFSRINDPATTEFEELFENKFTTAYRQDSYSDVVGRDLHL